MDEKHQHNCLHGAPDGPQLDRRGSLKAGDDDDAAMLEALGHKQELRRSFSTLSMLGLAFGILNTWAALAASLTLALPSGGTTAVIWGLIVSGLCNLCLAASLAEFLSAYPTAGGQYHWAAMISWERSRRAISFITGWISVCAWVSLCATGALLGSTLIVNVISLFHPDLEIRPWQQFLAYLGFSLAGFVISAFLNRLLPYLSKVAFFWSIGGFFIISITVVACASPNYQSARFVYGNFSNSVGWPDGLAWLVGLLQGTLVLTGYDATAHMIEEIPEPHVQGPRIMLYSVGIGILTGFIFLSCLLFCVKDVDNMTKAAYGPLLAMLMDATGSVAGSTCLLTFPLGCMLICQVALFTTSSRMSYAFARDQGMPFSDTFSEVHGKLDVPMNALIWSFGWATVFGFIFLGSSSTFNAITSASVVAVGVTYAIPPAINILRGRSMLPEDRYFRLPEPLGWIVNLVGILWTLLTTVLFVIPPTRPVTPMNMNYCIAAFGVMLLTAVLTWVLKGREHYAGPKVSACDFQVGGSREASEGLKEPKKMPTRLQEESREDGAGAGIADG